MNVPSTRPSEARIGIDHAAFSPSASGRCDSPRHESATARSGVQTTSFRAAASAQVPTPGATLIPSTAVFRDP